MGKNEKLTDEDLSMLDRTKRSEVKRLQKLLNSAASKGKLRFGMRFGMYKFHFYRSFLRFVIYIFMVRP